MLIFGDNTGMITSLKFSAALLPSVEWRHWSEGKDGNISYFLFIYSRKPDKCAELLLLYNAYVEYIKVFKLADIVKDNDHLKLQTIQAHKEWVREGKYLYKCFIHSFLRDLLNYISSNGMK